MSIRPETVTGSQNLRAAGLSTLGFAVFSGTDAVVKLMAQGLSVPQITFMITGFAFLLTVALTLMTGPADTLRPRQPGLALLRGLLLAVDTLLIYYAFAMLDLAEAYVLAFLTPALVALLAAILLGERLPLAGWIGIGMGFAGVIVALQPGARVMNLGHAAAFGSALVFAFSIILLRRIRAGESEAAMIAVLLAVLNLLALGLTLAGGGFVAVSPAQLGLAALAGFLTALGHLFLIRAGRIGAASIVAPFQYSQIIWACIYGLVLFNTPIEPHLLLGAAVIVLSGWLVLRPAG
ncbi:MAG: DMT family transporter [Gemmobacter sp.]|jgi:S-adenosylmethionine uptake transporter|nr:DMT family transporter [Gemmobacter sp.]